MKINKPIETIKYFIHCFEVARISYYSTVLQESALFAIETKLCLIKTLPPKRLHFVY